MHDHRYARHHEYVIHAEPLGTAGLVFDQGGTLRDSSHAQARCHDLGWCRSCLDPCGDVRMFDDGHVERFGNAVHRNVIVGRANSAGGKDVVVTTACRIDRADDVIDDVGDDASFPHLYTPAAQRQSDVVEVAIRRAPRQDFVADDQNACGDSGIAHEMSGSQTLNRNILVSSLDPSSGSEC